MEGDFEDAGGAQSRRKPDGGFCFFSVTQLVMAWTALREAEIGLKELRAYFALAEMKSRRCGCKDDDPPPEFTPLELRRLIGGAGGEREAVHKLQAVGLLREVSREPEPAGALRADRTFGPLEFPHAGRRGRRQGAASARPLPRGGLGGIAAWRGCPGVCGPVGRCPVRAVRDEPAASARHPRVERVAAGEPRASRVDA